MSAYDPSKVQYAVRKINVGFLSDDGNYRAELDEKTRLFDSQKEAEEVTEIEDVVVIV